MTAIYLVTDGEYSDYRVMGAFSTPEKAQAYVDANGGEFEAMVLDEQEGAAPRPWFRSSIDLKTGEITHRWVDTATKKPQDSESCIYGTSGRAGGHSAISQDHADKLAVEVRQAWLRRVTEP